ncbi:MAG: FAD-dependent oxidoreductase, partial [Candidatus Limnocylindrales bacterium]
SAVFVDASYEGDLLAAAGITYATGREDRSLHGESLAGRRELLPDPHQFRAAVRVEEAGGLARYTQPLDSIGLPGEGDGKVQSYCYRMCLTSDPANAEAIPAPAGYEPERYSAVAAYLAALGDRATVRDVLGIGELPSGKTDINSGGPISTNLLGASWAYVEADRETRARIAREHQDWAQGLLYFLGRDSAVPAAIQREVSRYGLPRDEFTDTDGWPHQLYIREACRMQGEHVMTQRDLTAERHKPDSIGMGGYNIDIREVQWVSCPVSRFPDVADEILQEGYLTVPVEPYQIPYRALLPRPEECTNLLVSTCISASHVAFSSFRLEPQYMIAGQAAGVAAALAAGSDGDVHEIDVEVLREVLQRDGAIL